VRGCGRAADDLGVNGPARKDMSYLGEVLCSCLGGDSKTRGFLSICLATLDAATREKVRAEISRMLDWCLANSYQPDGSFKVSDLDDTLGEVYRYGVSFLRETGHFRREDRFWTDQDFPEAKVVRDRIEAKLKSIGLQRPGVEDAYETLHAVE
jgi:hypothetical protein